MVDIAGWVSGSDNDHGRPTNNSGDKKKKIPTLYIAWTIDDGPTSHTKEMVKVFNTVSSKPIPVTWYIQYHNLLKFKQSGLGPAYYKTLQDKGHEVALHGIHPTTGSRQMTKSLNLSRSIKPSKQSENLKNI